METERVCHYEVHFKGQKVAATDYVDDVEYRFPLGSFPLVDGALAAKVKEYVTVPGLLDESVLPVTIEMQPMSPDCEGGIGAVFWGRHEVAVFEAYRIDG